VSDNDVTHEFVRITSGRIRQSVDHFVKSTEGLPNDLLSVSVAGADESRNEERRGALG
jgi:hypothetical protein